MVDVQKIRADFPGLHNGRVFLDNAATTHKPQAVIRRLASFYMEEYASVYRGGYPSALKAERELEAAREEILSFLGGTGSGELIFTSGTTAAINHVASAMAEKTSGGIVLISALEHASNRLPWEHFCNCTGARLQVVGLTDDGNVDTDSFMRQLTSQTRIVAVTMMSNVNGGHLQLKPVVEKAHQLGIPVLADGAQAVAHMPIDVSKLGVDFFCFSGHKLYGPMGIGGLYVRRECLADFPCFFYGGGMARQSAGSQKPNRWEAGTPNVAGILGLQAAIRYLQEAGWQSLLMRENNLACMAAEQLNHCQGYGILAVKDSPVLSLIPEFCSPYDLGVMLGASGFDVRVGSHCAPGALKALMERLDDRRAENSTQIAVSASKTPIQGDEYEAGSCRVSLSFYNTEEEISRLADCLQQLKGMRL